MKKIAVLALALAALFSQAAARPGRNQTSTTAKAFIIEMNSEGTVTKIEWDNKQIYPPLDKNGKPLLYDKSLDPFNVHSVVGDAFPKELNVGTNVTIRIFGEENNKDKFKITIIPKKTKYELAPIFTGETRPSSQEPLNRPQPTPKPLKELLKESSFILDESATTYAITVTRLGSPPVEDKDIFAENLQTLARYHFGSHIGIFFPWGKSTEYYLDAATNTTVMENNVWNVTMIFIGTFYPFGFEPDGECLSYRRIQVNLATELSSSILKKVYFGLGYDFTCFSVSILGRYGATQGLQDDFKPGVTYAAFKSVPTITKNKWDWGVTLCLPMDLMLGWLGKSLGLK